MAGTTAPMTEYEKLAVLAALDTAIAKAEGREIEHESANTDKTRPVFAALRKAGLSL